MGFRAGTIWQRPVIFNGMLLWGDELQGVVFQGDIPA